MNISRALAPEQPRQAATRQEPTSGFGLPVAIVVENVRLRDGEMALGLSALPGVRQVTGLAGAVAGPDSIAQGIQARLHQLMPQHETRPGGYSCAARGVSKASPACMRVDGLRLEMGHTVLTADGVLPHAQQAANFALQLDPLDMAEIGRLLQQ